MDDMTDKQIAHVRELCRLPGDPPADPLGRACFVGLTMFGFMLDALAADRAKAAQGKKK